MSAEVTLQSLAFQISGVCHYGRSFAWHNPGFTLGEVAEWLMAADCKSALLRVRWFESSPLHQVMSLTFFG